MALPNHAAVQLALRNHALAMSGFPVMPDGNPAIACDNVPFTPIDGHAYVVEQYAPAGAALLGVVQGGTVRTQGLYCLRWMGVQGQGLSAIATGVDGLLAQFAPGTSLTATSGDVVRIRGDVAPYRGQMLPMDGGWVACLVTIPFYCLTPN